MEALTVRNLARILYAAVFAAGAICIANVARAGMWSFVPTALEWQIWPEYCRVQYTIYGDPLPYEGYAEAKQGVPRWRSVIGQQTFDGLHHYCAALHYMTRSMAETDPRQKSFLMDTAWDNAQFTYFRSESSSPVYPAISVGTARIRFAMGKPDEAVTILKHSIDVQPQSMDAYVMLAVIYRKQKRLDDAVAVMQAADKVLGGKSLEVQYNLGLIYMEKGDFGAAEKIARKVYDQGYPLPGLQDELRAKGHWPPTD